MQQEKEKILIFSTQADFVSRIDFYDLSLNRKFSMRGFAEKH